MTDKELREYAQFHERCDLLEAIRRFRTGELKSLKMRKLFMAHPELQAPKAEP